MTLHCPDCGTGLRVPHRTRENTGAAPGGYLPPPPPERSPRRVDRAPEPVREVWTPTVRPTPARPAVQPVTLPGLGGGGFLGSLLQTLSGPTPAAAPARPAPAPRATSPAPARPRVVLPDTTAVTPSRTEQQDRIRRDRVCTISGTLGGRFRVWYDQPLGSCEVLDTEKRREDQRCQVRPARAVVFRSRFTGQSEAYVCPDHAWALASMADHAQDVSATVHPMTF